MIRLKPQSPYSISLLNLFAQSPYLFTYTFTLIRLSSANSRVQFTDIRISNFANLDH